MSDGKAPPFVVPALHTAHDGHSTGPATAAGAVAGTPMAAGTPHAVHAPAVALPTRAEDYEVICEIGAGAFAQVYKAVVKGTKEEVAIKIVDLDQFNTNWDEIRKEIMTMSSMHHSNVVKILQSFADGSELWIVMPLLSGGSCASLMKSLSPSGFKDEALIATILMESLKGLHYLHKDGRIHRDIKAGNILISGRGDVMLGDFGVSGTLMENGDRKKNRQTFTGTPCWMAPEVMEQTAGYDYKADIWSFGITAMELAYGRAPYSQFQPMKVLLLTLQEEPPTCEIYKDNQYKFSKHFHSLIAKCLRKDPTKRPNTTKLLGHKFFRSAKNREYIVQQVISKMPPPPSNAESKARVTKQATGKMNNPKSKPVELPSLILDGDEYNALKKEIDESKKAAAAAAAASTGTAADGTAAAHHPANAPPPISTGKPFVVPENQNVLHIHTVGEYGNAHNPASPSSASTTGSSTASIQSASGGGSAGGSRSANGGGAAAAHAHAYTGGGGIGARYHTLPLPASSGSNNNSNTGSSTNSSATSTPLSGHLPITPNGGGAVTPAAVPIANIPKSHSNSAINLLSPMLHNTPPINLAAAASAAGPGVRLSNTTGSGTTLPPPINTHSPLQSSKPLGSTLGAPLTPSAGSIPNLTSLVHAAPPAGAAGAGATTEHGRFSVTTTNPKPAAS